MMQPEFNREKFHELMLYISQKSIDDPRFGNTKLAKILCLSDFLLYALHGKTLTGAVYRKYRLGPAPEALWDSQAALRKAGDAVVVDVPRDDHIGKRCVPLREPNLEIFSALEISLVDSIIHGLWDKTGDEVSDLSHKSLVGWQLAGDEEEIPYATIFLSPHEASDADVRRGQQLAKERGWKRQKVA